MVSIGDTVFVTPVNGQKDYIAVITGPGGGTGAAGTSGIIEGDYNTWTKKWVNLFPDGISTAWYFDAYIDEVNEVINIAWSDSGAWYRFGIYNISDFSVVQKTTSGADYMYSHPYMERKEWIIEGMAWFEKGGISKSNQTYLLLRKQDQYTIEVWRAGASALWTRNTRTDLGANCYCYSAGLSLTGKYILAQVKEIVSPYKYYLMLYEGFDAGTSTTVTETTISDTSKSWATNDLIGHIVYITSGGANEQQGTITSNTGITITCSAATFVTWGMSVGDTYKIS